MIPTAIVLALVVPTVAADEVDPVRANLQSDLRFLSNLIDFSGPSPQIVDDLESLDLPVRATAPGTVRFGVLEAIGDPGRLELRMPTDISLLWADATPDGTVARVIVSSEIGSVAAYLTLTTWKSAPDTLDEVVAAFGLDGAPGWSETVDQVRSSLKGAPGLSLELDARHVPPPADDLVTLADNQLLRRVVLYRHRLKVSGGTARLYLFSGRDSRRTIAIGTDAALPNAAGVVLRLFVDGKVEALLSCEWDVPSARRIAPPQSPDESDPHWPRRAQLIRYLIDVLMEYES